MDEDLKNKLSNKHLIKEIIKLRNSIRLHRDEKGHDRCWLDDERLYSILPENLKGDLSLPPKCEFLENCEKYWETRKNEVQKERNP